MTNEQREMQEWEAPPLSAEDQRLVDAYRRNGRSIDDLPYTEEFEKLCADVGRNSTNEERHGVFRRLLNLRKQGRLPRVYGMSSSGSSSV